jgi:Protein of unknown function (DUF3710)
VQVFGRRRRDGGDPAAPDASEDEYLADDGELPEDEDLLADYQEDDYPEDDYPEDDYPEDDESESDQDHDGSDADVQDEGAPQRRRHRRTGRPNRDDLGDPVTWTRLRDTATAEPAHRRSEGPWDSADPYPEAERIDLGCLLVPVREGSDVQIGFSEEAGISIAVVSGDSALQLLPFAAPRSSGLWHEVMDEIAAEVASAGGRSEQRDGPFGPELLAWISPPTPDGSGLLPPQPLRFLGADGPRWFLRGLIQGPAALDSALAAPLEAVFAEVVVVRGDHAVPQRHPLEIKLPQEAQQLIEGEIEQQQQDGMPNPFERGPEITEIR